MTRAQLRDYKKGNQLRKQKMLADRTGWNGRRKKNGSHRRNLYGQLHIGVIQDGRHTPAKA